MFEFSEDLMWWITIFDIPALSGLFWIVWRNRREHDEVTRHLSQVLDTRHSQMREALSAFKLEVAKTYASLSDMKDLEMRLIAHLLRIEGKLDKTAMKAEALSSMTTQNKG